jgi:hypothetical protein
MNKMTIFEVLSVYNSKYQSLWNWLKVLWSIYRKSFSINLKFRSLSMHVNWCDVRFERTLLDIDNPLRYGTAVVFCRKQKFGTSFNLLLSILRYLIPVKQLNVTLNHGNLWKGNCLYVVFCCIVTKVLSAFLYRDSWKYHLFRLLSISYYLNSKIPLCYISNYQTIFVDLNVIF